MKIRLLTIDADNLSPDSARAVFETLRGLLSETGQPQSPQPADQPSPAIAAPSRPSSPDNGKDYAPRALALPRPRQTHPGRLAQAASGPKKRSPARSLVCLEKPGETFTPDQAAELAGTSRKVLLQSITPSAIRKGIRAGGYTFRRADETLSPTPDSLPQTPDHETRPRQRNGAGAINPYIAGSAAPVPQAAERPTPEEFQNL